MKGIFYFGLNGENGFRNSFFDEIDKKLLFLKVKIKSIQIINFQKLVLIDFPRGKTAQCKERGRTVGRDMSKIQNSFTAVIIYIFYNIYFSRGVNINIRIFVLRCSNILSIISPPSPSLTVPTLNKLPPPSLKYFLFN